MKRLFFAAIIKCCLFVAATQTADAAYKHLSDAYFACAGADGGKSLDAISNYCEALCDCVEGENPAFETANVAESIFFLGYFSTTDGCTEFQKNSPGIVARAERDATECLSKHFKQRTGADVFPLQAVVGAKLPSFRERFDLPDDPFSQIKSELRLLLSANADSAEKYAYYGRLSDANVAISTAADDVKGLVERPFVLYWLTSSLSAGDGDAKNISAACKKFLGQWHENPAGISIPQDFCEFCGFQFNDELLSSIDEKSRCFYECCFCAKWLFSLSKRYGIAMSLFCNEDELSTLKKLATDPQACLSRWEDDRNVALSRVLRSICESICWIAPRLYLRDYGVNLK